MGDPSGSQRSVGGRKAGPSSPRPGPASSSDSRGRHPRPYRHLVARLLRTLRLAPAWPRLARLFSKEASAPPSSPSWAFAPAKCACCRSRARRRAPGHVPRGLTVTPNARRAAALPRRLEVVPEPPAGWHDLLGWSPWQRRGREPGEGAASEQTPDGPEHLATRRRPKGYKRRSSSAWTAEAFRGRSSRKRNVGGEAIWEEVSEIRFAVPSSQRCGPSTRNGQEMQGRLQLPEQRLCRELYETYF